MLTLSLPLRLEAASYVCPDVFTIVDAHDANRFFSEVNYKSDTSVKCRYPEAIDVLVSGLKSNQDRDKIKVLETIQAHWDILVHFHTLDPKGYEQLVELLESLASRGDERSKEAYQALRG